MTATPLPAAIKIPVHLRELAESLPLTLSPTDVAAVLQVNARTVRRMLARGELHAVRTIAAGSARYVIPRSELIRFMMERSA